MVSLLLTSLLPCSRLVALFCEWMTNMLQFALLKDDEGYYLGALLTRLMPPKDTVQRKGVLSSIKVLTYSQPVAKARTIARSSWRP